MLTQLTHRRSEVAAEVDNPAAHHRMVVGMTAGAAAARNIVVLPRHNPPARVVVL